MSDLDTVMVKKYRNNFLKEVEANVEEGEWVKMCMQCGVCAGSCPLGPYWEHPPQEIFMMIRAGKRDEILRSSSMWMCTSCYNCIVRCPRELPITHIMHGLAHYAERLGIAPKQNPTRKFARIFWGNLTKAGRVNEPVLGVGLYFMNGFKEGIRTTLKMAPVGMGMMKTKRFNPFAFMFYRGCKGKKDIHKIIKKARELELAKAAKFGG
ncbi:succinate dehydrogenase iron-sulfur subunit [bacterium BMS3Bbin12]|nr:succinate dehydrogenase iron-sulfur subunit [bacterium BMS3Abin12]GBE47036.1 succinate dehydrogenase iron-sulfur subunit [bacterium BMS3Bbin12]GBE50458.1 succinate dehydrogenase iron-sulfur subunit [bacterium BMS3Bbin13]HDJ85578.1 4Fe-4S dicluster domain-containing protein [Chromatiales bacterium]